MSDNKDLKKLVDDVHKTNQSVVKELDQLTLAGKQTIAPELLEKLQIAQGSYEELQKYLEDNEEKKRNDEKQKLGHKKVILSPEEQELTYELKAQMMRQIDVQNAKLKTELKLHGKKEELRVANQVNRRLHDEWTMSRTNSMKLLKMFERKAKEANDKVNQLQIELLKSKQLAKKYHDMYETECRNNGHPPRVQSARSTSSEGAESNKSNTQLLRKAITVPGHRLPDYQRRFEVLLVENEELKRDINRLRADNAELVKTAKHAQASADAMTHHLGTSEMARKDLIKKFHRQQKQHNQLEKSLTRQACDWVQQKKKMQALEQEYRWSQVNPMAILGSEQRTYAHPVQRNVDQPRMMFPVTSYASANT
ncbi:uncharacterized protein LOC141901939 isoform X2 [Tubulanus polymorphus]|uniref:uncharacterized protein LOC141901939 isoform X2 n=1 Tax=Tubulanus polymorphus TaxID=672921 RepID=UPI003DA3BCA1